MPSIKYQYLLKMDAVHPDSSICIAGHTCNNQWIVIRIVDWEGVSSVVADSAFDKLTGLGQ
jgi:hypothetical protein